MKANGSDRTNVTNLARGSAFSRAILERKKLSTLRPPGYIEVRVANADGPVR